VVRCRLKTPYRDRTTGIETKLRKYPILAHDLLQSYDLAHVALAALDRKTGGDLAAAYLGRLGRGAAASGVGEAFLEVRPTNLAAIRLYQRLGFEQIGIRRGYYQAPDGREDAIVLKLDLRQS
jgi:ribosomal-protein-alanine N-acetyltransferase